MQQQREISRNCPTSQKICQKGPNGLDGAKSAVAYLFSVVDLHDFKTHIPDPPIEVKEGKGRDHRPQTYLSDLPVEDAPVEDGKGRG
jgi:hypothetical protein